MPQFNDLLQKFIQDELTEKELQSFLELVREPANQATVKEAIDQFMDAEKYTDLTAGMDPDHQFIQVLKKAKEASQQLPARPVHRVHFIRKWWWAAAAVLFTLAASTYFLFRTGRQDTPVVAQHPVNIAPGKEGAILTLADGTKVVLDSLGNGIIATQNGAQVVLENGQLTYDPTGKIKGEATYNTMTTPKGRQFQLLLPDGTRVWLNAASSIKYPTVFDGEERRVSITGEAYFEVAKNAKMPFRVAVSNQAVIEVLGTHFNVNAYKDDAAIKTTLLEGSVRVKAEESIQNPASGIQHEVILKPGQQAQFLVSSQSINSNESRFRQMLVEEADLDKVMAWKNGFFNFEGVSVGEAMKQLERWYDITVVYEKGIPNIKFFGEISRNVNLADLTNVLKDVGVNFRIEPGRRLVVLP